LREIKDFSFVKGFGIDKKKGIREEEELVEKASF